MEKFKWTYRGGKTRWDLTEPAIYWGEESRVFRNEMAEVSITEDCRAVIMPNPDIIKSFPEGETVHLLLEYEAVPGDYEKAYIEN